MQINKNIPDYTTDNDSPIKIEPEQDTKAFHGVRIPEESYQKLEKLIYTLELDVFKKDKELQNIIQEKEDIKRHISYILESITIGVIVCNLEQKITIFNRWAEQITNISSKDAIGKRIDSLFYKVVFEKSKINWNSLDLSTNYSDLEIEIYLKGSNKIHANLNLCPLINHHDEMIGRVLTLQDITIMKKMEEEANRTSHLASMGKMAAKIAHEIRNPLGSIELFSSILKKDLGNSNESIELVDNILSGVKSINNIIANLLLFVKPQQKPTFQLIDIHAHLDESLFFSSHLVKDNEWIKVTKKYCKQPIHIQGDSELLKQMSLNLLLNSIQAMQNGGELVISTRKVGFKGLGKCVEINFCDNGIGILSENKNKIFDPFFTTKSRGTGLGLTIVHNIIKLHRGTINLSSLEKRGTVCTVLFPLINDFSQ